MRYFYYENSPDKGSYFKYDEHQSTMLAYFVSDLEGLIEIYEATTPIITKDILTGELTIKGPGTSGHKIQEISEQDFLRILEIL